MKRLEKGCFCMELNKAAALIGRLLITGTILTLIHLDRVSASEYNTIEYTSTIVVCVISLVINCCLLCAVRKNSKCLTLPWIIWYLFIIIAYNVVTVFEFEDSGEPELLCYLLIIDVVWLYIIACIVSFHISLGEKPDSESIPYNGLSNITANAENVENV